MLKVLGLLLIFLSFASAGVVQSSKLKRRLKRLEEFLGCLAELDARLLYAGAERERLLKECFGGKMLLEPETAQLLPNSGFSAEDCAVLEEFLGNFGSGETAAEHERICLCRERLMRQRDAAQSENETTARLYRTLGISAGAVCCLLLI